MNPNDATPGSAPGAAHGRGFWRGPLVVVAILVLMASLTLGAVIAPTLAMRDRTPALDTYGQVPAFRLTDQTGATVTDAALRGKVVIANFIFTRCITVCPVFTMKMRRVQDRTQDVADGLKLVSFSVDPLHDTPAVLARYAEEHGADPGRWRFLTGEAEAMRRVAEAFAVPMDAMGTQPNGAPDIVHAEHFVLIDRQGQIRGYYASSDAPRIEIMLRDARRLLAARE